MKINKWLDEVACLCAEPGPEDGIDPRYLSSAQGQKVDHQKSSRLCNEVVKVLSLVLTGEMSDPLLQAMLVIDVAVEGNGQFLRVSLGHQEPGMEIDEMQVLAALTQAQGYLRSVIAQRINRKRVPALRFHYVGLIEPG
ncbi:MAG: ribosome-binding factor A [Gammaproteobacteria bacterium]|nr:ribosome-binding factor A [Gammaproteobacteria bacterium]